MKKERKGKHFIKKPIYQGGPAALKQFISQQMQYPEEALSKKKEGTVLIRYTINHKGKVIETKIISGLGFGCDEEADRLVRLLKFVVPRNRGVKAIFHKELHIHFRLPKTKDTSVQYQIIPKKKEDPAPIQKEEGGYTITINW